MQVAHSASAALWFLPFVLPICIFVAWNDMRAMKIPNIAVYALVGVFAVVGLITLPLDVYAWRWLHLIVVLLIGMVLNAAGALGAGDAKFAAAAAPFVALSDLSTMLYILAGCTAGGYIIHRIVRASPLRKLVPDWESWTAGKRFPLGFPLGAALAYYIAIPLI
ncbi:MAG: prepilin peptidase CpaA [Paracoccaceae bacterium]|jgi:prepilin peptidase CpaA